MPELPEVEVVRAGVDRWVAGRRIAGVQVHNDRAVRRHPAGAGDFAAQLEGRTLGAAQRRGKFLWLPLGDDGGASDGGAGSDGGASDGGAGSDGGASDGGAALVVHLGMSGQLLLDEREGNSRHLRVRFAFDDDGPDLRFVDQRTFGWVAVEPIVAGVAGRPVPLAAAAIATDPLEPGFDAAATARRLRGKRTAVKAALLDQNLVSGIGNLYADETLWRCRRHWATPADRLTQAHAVQLLSTAAAVMTEALAVGGTSFDSLYVNVNGESGYFSRSLDAYGRAGRPCHRCGALMVREAFANRSSYRCPRCQRRPRGLR